MTRHSSRGFTLLEVMIAGALLAFVTAAAMASYVAQLQLTNTQQQSTNATDEVREAMRLIGNDVRSAAPGINAGINSGGATGQAGATNTQGACPVGTVAYSSSTVPLICIPPIFRSTSPLAQLPLAGSNGGQGQCGNQATSPGYQLTFGGLVEPSAGKFFCPDDLVITAVDDSNPFFVSGLPPSSIPITVGTAATDPRLLFMTTPAGTNLTAQTSLNPNGLASLTGNPMMLISGANGPVLINTPSAVGVTDDYASTTGAGVVPFGFVPVTLGGTLTDLFGSAGTGYPVAMPARLVQYSIQPVTATDSTTWTAATPFVSANLVRTELTPVANSSGSPPLYFANTFSTVLVKGVIDMQVEFGLDPLGTGQLQYVNSGGYQNIPQLEPVAPAAPAAPPAPEATIQHVSATCLAGGLSTAKQGALFPGTCFPAGPPDSTGGMQYVRSVRLNLLVRW